MMPISEGRLYFYMVSSLPLNKSADTSLTSIPLQSILLCSGSCVIYSNTSSHTLLVLLCLSTYLHIVCARISVCLYMYQLHYMHKCQVNSRACWLQNNLINQRTPMNGSIDERYSDTDYNIMKNQTISCTHRYANYTFWWNAGLVQAHTLTNICPHGIMTRCSA